MLAVRTAELLDLLGEPRPFMALPREEIERLHASIEVLSVGSLTPEFTALKCWVATHYNYSWLTFSRGAARSLVLDGPMIGDRDALFLDDGWAETARRLVDWGPGEVRLAGLSPACAGELGLVYVAKLRQPALASVQVEGQRCAESGDHRPPRGILSGGVDSCAAFRSKRSRAA